MFGQRNRGEDGIPADVDPPKLGLFALACPMQQPSIMEIYVRNMIFRTKHRLDFKPQSLDSKLVFYVLNLFYYPFLSMTSTAIQTGNW